MTAALFTNKTVEKFFQILVFFVSFLLLTYYIVLDMPKTKLSNRKVDLANHEVPKTSEPLDTANIVIDTKKLNNLTKALPKIKKIKKEKVEVVHSVTTTSTPGVKTQSLEELKVDPNDFLQLDENAEIQVKMRRARFLLL